MREQLLGYEMGCRKKKSYCNTLSCIAIGRLEGLEKLYCNTVYCIARGGRLGKDYIAIQVLYCRLGRQCVMIQFLYRD